MAGVVFFVVVGLVVAGLVVWSTQRTNSTWGEAARRLGIEVESASLGHPRLGGMIDNVVVLVDVKGSGDNARTRYRVTFPPLNPKFNLKRESGTQKIMRALGVADVEIGERDFDDAFDIATDHPDALRALLTPARRYGLLRLFAVNKNLSVTENSLEATVKRIARNPEAIEGMVRRLVATAQLMTGTATTASLDAAISDRAGGELGSALEKLDAIVAEHPEDVEARVLQAETALSMGESKKAQESATAAATALPGDLEATGIRDAAAGVGAGPTETRPAAPEADVDSDSTAMFDDLFGRSRLSFESDKKFDESYRGRRVRWSGPVQTARQYESDLDFGSGPGTKAVVRVATISSDLYGNTEVDAVVALPAGLTFSRGDVVTFTGTLHRVDAMMRNVYVADGRVA